MTDLHPDADPIEHRLRVAQSIIGQCLHNLRELAGVLALLAIDADRAGALSQEVREVVEPSLGELDALLTKALEFFPHEGS